MTRGTVRAAGTRRRIKTQVPAGSIPAGGRRQTELGPQSPARRRACPRVAALRRCHVRRPRALHLTDRTSRRPPLARCAFPASADTRPVYRTCLLRAWAIRILMRCLAYSSVVQLTRQYCAISLPRILKGAYGIGVAGPLGRFLG
jgi:hypothetical protein